MSDSTKTEQSLSEAWGENRVPIIALAFCFVLSHVLAMFIVPAFEEAKVPIKRKQNVIIFFNFIRYLSFTNNR